MATTTLNGALTASGTQLTLTAYTAPGGRAKPLMRVDDEIMLITNTTNTPTLGVVRGYMGTTAVAHTTQAGVEYNTPDAFSLVSKGPWLSTPTLANPTLYYPTQEVTATGATGSTATAITQPSPAFLNATGTSGTGLNLGVPVVGSSYTIKNNSTGALQIFAVGATINGTTGTTAFTLTATGNKMVFANCATAGAWQIAGNT